MEKRSHRHIRDLVAHPAFQGLDANEIGCVRISMMAGSKALHSGPNTDRKTNYLQIVTSGLHRTAGTLFWLIPVLISWGVLTRISHPTNGLQRDKPRLMAGVLRPRARCGLFFGFSVGQLVGAARVAPRRGVSCGRGAGDGCDGETDRGTSPILGGRTGRRHGDLDAADADANQRTDLEELEPDGAASRLRGVGIVEANAAQGARQDVSHRVKP